jgi:hypothetical protein
VKNPAARIKICPVPFPDIVPPDKSDYLLIRRQSELLPETFLLISRPRTESLGIDSPVNQAQFIFQ